MKDYYEKDIIKKCDVCGNAVAVDSVGNGTCKHCGWVQGADEEAFELANKISYPNLVPLSRAREQYRKGLSFKPTLEDFVNGLLFYGEMIFKYKGEVFEVDLVGDRDKEYKIVYGSKRFCQEFSSVDEFISLATIDGKPLKDIWQEVTNAGFMSCI